MKPRTPAARDIEKIKTNMEKERSAVEALLGATSRQKLDVFLVDSLKRMKELVGSERHSWASDTIIGATYGDDGIRRVGAHEILHCLALKLWGRPSGLWASEGLAVYSEDEWRDIPLHLLAKWLLDKGQLLPMSTLTNSDSWKTNMITYPQCGSFVKFIYERYGMAVIYLIGFALLLPMVVFAKDPPLPEALLNAKTAFVEKVGTAARILDKDCSSTQGKRGRCRQRT